MLATFVPHAPRNGEQFGDESKESCGMTWALGLIWAMQRSMSLSTKRLKPYMVLNFATKSCNTGLALQKCWFFNNDLQYLVAHCITLQYTTILAICRAQNLALQLSVYYCNQYIIYSTWYEYISDTRGMQVDLRISAFASDCFAHFRTGEVRAGVQDWVVMARFFATQAQT